MNDKQQAAFDDLINRHGLCIAKDSDLYRSHLVGWMLKAYEAALASPEVQALRKDAERLDFMISEECQIQSLSLSNGVRHRLYWPDADEAQCEWSVNPRAAIDEAMEKQK